METFEHCDIRTAARLLNVNRSELLSALHDSGVLVRRGKYYHQPRFEFIQAGLFSSELTSYTKGKSEKVYVKPLVTLDGLVFIERLLESDIDAMEEVKRILHSKQYKHERRTLSGEQNISPGRAEVLRMVSKL